MKITTINTIETEHKWNDQVATPLDDILVMKKTIESQKEDMKLYCPFCSYEFPNHWEKCIQNRIKYVSRVLHEDNNYKYNRNIKSL